MVTVGLIEDPSKLRASEGRLSWIHALDLKRFHIELTMTMPTLEEALRGTGSLRQPDVWIARSNDITRCSRWQRFFGEPSGDGKHSVKPIVALCGGEREEIGEVLRRGVAAVVQVCDSPWHLAAAIHSAAALDLFVSPPALREYRRDVIDLFSSTEETTLDSLTEREREVLTCLAHGMSNPMIAAHLHITRATVGSHVLRILRKLDASNRTEAAAIAHSLGLVGNRRSSG